MVIKATPSTRQSRTRTTTPIRFFIVLLKCRGRMGLASAHRGWGFFLRKARRNQLEEAVRYQPYRVQRIRALATPACDNVKVDALVAKVRELLEERIDLGLPFPFPVMSPEKSETATPTPPSFSPKEILNYLDSISD